MNWILVLTHALAIYAGFGAWLGYVWTRAEGQGVAVSLLTGLTLGVLIAPLCAVFDGEMGVPDVKRRRIKSKAARLESKRMANELAREEGAVEMLEASASHRRKMGELAERRRRAEEVA